VIETTLDLRVTIAVVAALVIAFSIVVSAWLRGRRSRR